MAESTGVEQSTGAEPDKYFNGKQWYSAKRGEWIDPSQEIRTDAMKPQTDQDTETNTSTETDQPEILNETEKFIEKLEAVERDRKESEVSEVGEEVMEDVKEEVVEDVK